jgi:hypothetical protein
MTQSYTLFLPPLLALALCLHLGYAFARLALPRELQPYRAMLTPLAGCALFLVITAALTTTTPLTPPQIAAGLAVLAVPVNAWAHWRGRRSRGQEAGSPADREPSPSLDSWPRAWFPVLGSERPFVVLCVLLSVLVFALAILPPLRWGLSAPIGSNWDAAEFYVPLARALQLRSQRDIPFLPPNPLVEIFSTPPVSGRIHAFSYLHAAASSAAGVEPLHSYAPLMALVLALQPLAVYPLARVLRLPRAAALLATALVALAWLPLWVAYNSFSNHLMALPLLPIALASSLTALRCGGRAALACGALFVAGLATAYYPAMTAYVALLGPAALYLLWAWRSPAGDRRPIAAQASNPGNETTADRPPVSGLTSGGRWAVATRGLLLAALAFALSGPAQVYFFLRPGFRDEILRSGGGFQVTQFVELHDALGLAATFNREELENDARLVALAAGLALVLGGVALAGRRVPLLVGLAAGAAAYQAFTAVRAYHYGFYKGVTFEIPVYAALIAAGAALVWEPARRAHARLIVRGALAGGLALILALNVGTIWRVQQRYSAAGPQLWNVAELEAAGLRAQVPPGASVLVVPSPAHPPTFNSLISYALLGHETLGRFRTGYNTDYQVGDPADGDRLADFALLPEGSDPSGYGYAAREIVWAGAGMQLYGRNSAVRYHRELGGGGRYPALAAGQALTLRLGPDGIALPDEQPPASGKAQRARLTLAIASFGPATLEIGRPDGAREQHTLPGGLVELTSAPLTIPGELQLHNAGDEPVYLWWVELRTPDAPSGLVVRDAAFVQVLPQPPTGGSNAVAGLRLHTQALPEGRQKLTGLLIVAHRSGDGDNWTELGRWVFFPAGGRQLQLALNLVQLTASLTQDGQASDLFGSAAPAGDGAYQATLLLANNAQIVYGTTLWAWRINSGQPAAVATDQVGFDVVPLPQPATQQVTDSHDGTIRLRGYTLPRRPVRPGETITISLVWQSLRKIGGDLSARVALHDRQGRILAARALPIGAPEHGTSRWQEGEIAAQSFALAVPGDVSGGVATLTVELLGPDGQTLPLGGAQPLRVAEITIER